MRIPRAYQDAAQYHPESHILKS
jgi:hypothetical protein